MTAGGDDRSSARTGFTVRGFLALGLVALLAAPARAIDFFELEVYPATTDGAGVHEIENLTTFVANGRNAREDHDGERRHRLLRTSLEYNYGLTDRIDVAAYLDLAKPNGDQVEYAGARFRARGGLWDKGRFFLDLGWYLEAAVPHDGESDLELEFRPIVSRDFGRFTVDVNPIFELPTVSEERRTLEFAYAARAYYRLAERLQPGVELFGGIGQIRDVDASQKQEHYVLPILYGRVGRGWSVSLGTAFGLTRASDPVIVKLGVEYEIVLP